MIDARRLLQWSFEDVEQSYSADFAMLYGLSIGIGSDPRARRALRFVSELAAEGLRAFPTMAVVLGYPGPWLADPGTGVDYARIVHGEEALTLHAPLPVSGTVVARHAVRSVIDKGKSKGAVIVYDKDLYDKASGTHLATVRHTTFARGDGGFSGEARAARPARSAGETHAPPTIAHRVEIPVLPQQALLYRLCADRNPLHADPSAAAAAGFTRPILHGLCTFGMVAHAILAARADCAADRLRFIGARFVAPVMPGDRLVVESWGDGDEIGFQARCKGSERLVLSAGSARIGATGRMMTQPPWIDGEETR